MKRILIVEDDATIVLGLERALHNEHYETLAAYTGTEGLRLARERHPDLLILDLMLPEMSGLEICKRLRDEKIMTPVIMLTAKAEEEDKVLGLELGADDYVTKPFSLRELLARVRAQLRREEATVTLPPAPKAEKYEFAEVEIDFKRREVRKNGKLQDLTNREFSLLEYFVHHPGELLTRDRLLNEIWGYQTHPTTRTVDTHILRLRKHIEPNPENPRYIKTIRVAGYLFEAES
jgi:DNA-binding response OmpR family regulator